MYWFDILPFLPVENNEIVNDVFISCDIML